MGLGKTLTMISLILRQRADESDKAADKDDERSASWLLAGQKGTGIVCMLFRLISLVNKHILSHL